MVQEKPEKAKFDVWTKLQAERSEAMQEQENNDIQAKIQNILAHAPKEIDTEDGKYPFWQWQYNRARACLGFVSYHQEAQTQADKFCAEAATQEDIFALPHYEDIVFLIRDGETAKKFRYEGRAAAAWERLKESYKVLCTLQDMVNVTDEKLNEIRAVYKNADNDVLQAMHDNIEDYQRSLIEKHASDPDFIVRLANSIKICAAVIAGQSTTVLHTMQGEHSGPKTFDKEHDISEMTPKEKEEFYTVLLSQVKLFTYSRINNRFLNENNRSFGGVQIYLSYLKDKDESLHKELRKWAERLFKRNTWPSVKSSNVRAWLSKHPKEAKTKPSSKKTSSSADDAKPHEDELANTAEKLEKRVRDFLMKPSSQPLRAMKGALGSGLNADRLKDRIEESSHTSALTKLEDNLDFSVLIETREKGKRKNGTAVAIDSFEKKFSTLQRRAPAALDYLDFFTSYALDNVIAGGELIKEEIVIPYDAFLTKNGGFCDTKGQVCKAIGRYGPILMGLMLAGEYKPVKKGDAKETLTEHDFIHPFRRITNRNGYVRVLLEPEFNWGLLFRYRYQVPPYFWNLQQPTSRRILDRALETARIAGTEHRRERSETLVKKHTFKISLSSALRDTNIPTPEQTKHPRRDIIDPVVFAIRSITEQEALEKQKCLTLELVADKTNVNTFLQGYILLTVYGDFADRLLAQAERSIQRRKTNARKAEKRKENVEYRLAKDAAKN